MQFDVNFMFKGGLLAPDNELAPFCGYVETQLRLAHVLAQQGRPYAAELVLGECAVTADMICGTAPDVLRYRVARANSWAQVAQLLAQDRPDEAILARQWAAATWRDTVVQVPQAAQYCSGLHGGSTDRAWFEAAFPGQLTAQASLAYQPLAPSR